MSTHDVLASAVAQQIIHDIAAGNQLWSAVLTPNVHRAGSRGWPVPDAVIQDTSTNVAMALEFKPPDQTKREYLTGLGQAVAYTRDFHYAALAVPNVADDDYRIADHIKDVLGQSVAATLPVGLVQYDAGTLSAGHAHLTVLRPLRRRGGDFSGRPPVESSFFAKWREASPNELGRFLEYLYEEGRTHDPTRSVRDRAFDRLWADIVGGQTTHWQGGTRNVRDTPANRTGWGKNYRNFATHIGWCGPEGKLTDAGLEALRIVHLYGAGSRVFIDSIARAVLEGGKHLVLINAINEFQDRNGIAADEATWLAHLELGLENAGLLKRNPGRHQAAVQQSARGFLKSEKQLWRNLDLIVPRGGRVFHPGRGFIFDWSRITSLIGA